MSFNLTELEGQLKAISAENAACTSNLKTAERKLSISMETYISSNATASGADPREIKRHEEAMEEITKALESAYKVQEKVEDQVCFGMQISQGAEHHVDWEIDCRTAEEEDMRDPSVCEKGTVWEPLWYGRSSSGVPDMESECEECASGPLFAAVVGGRVWHTRT